MKVKELIVALLDMPMEAHAFVTVPDEYDELSIEEIKNESTSYGQWVYLRTERPSP